MQYVAIFILVFSGGIAQDRLEAFDNEKDCKDFLVSYEYALSQAGFFSEHKGIKYYGICAKRTKPVIKIW